ncbi:MAG: ROK family protein [Clostridia bacterium]|nr:ROK family protein [Clostridia bacterium]
MKKYIGIDIGGTKCAVIVGEYENDEIRIISRTAFATDIDEEPTDIIEKFCEIISAEKDFSAIGISCGGPLDSRTGVILCPPNLPKWIDVPIVEMLSSHFGVPVFLQNDANACALAEWKLGAGRGTQNMIFLTFGTGFGAGLILDGRLYVGTSDMAGEVGHVRLTEDGPEGYGKKGSAEGYCSGGGIRNIGRLFGIDKSAKDIALDAKNGDPTALDIYRTSGKYLGRTLAILADILNPECVVIGSVFARSEELLRPAMQAELEKEALSHTVKCLDVRPALLGDEIGDYAALMTAVYGALI